MQSDYTVRIGMKFWIEKSAMLVMKIGKGNLSDGMELPNEKKIKMLEE